MRRRGKDDEVSALKRHRSRYRRNDPTMAASELRPSNREKSDEIQRLTHELTEALEQQTATADVLKAISGSAFELDSVLQAVLDSAIRLCRATRGHIYVFDGKSLNFAVASGALPEFVDYLRKHPLQLDMGSVAGRVALKHEAVHVHDVLEDPLYDRILLTRQQEYHTVLGVPMLRDDTLVGVINILKSRIEPFTDQQIQLVSTFADQAVIAVENTRLLNELSESLKQQTATADVLKAISRSTFDLDTVLNTLLQSVARLCEGHISWIFQRDGEVLRWAASYGLTPDVHVRIREFFKPLAVPIDRGSVVGRAALEADVVHVQDVLADPEYKWGAAQEIGGYRACLGAPLLRDGKVVGVLFVAKTVARPFTGKQIDLVKTFADQAVIAIENVRLFDEAQTRNRELSEALEQQKATSEILGVISSTRTDIQPVFETIVQNAVSLCGSLFANVFRFDGEMLHYVASHNVGPSLRDKLAEYYPVRANRSQISGRAILAKSVVRLEDALCDPEYDQRFARAMGWRSLVGVPMLRDGEPIGALVLGWAESGPVPKAQEKLLQTFADQAVIAIENVRLFDEVQERTEELSEALQRQTATAEVLKVISRSAFDLKTVLKTLVEAAAHLCQADQGTIAREQKGVFRRVASYGFSAEFDELISIAPVEHERGSATGRALAEGHIVHIPDVQADPEYTFTEAKKLGGFRTILAVPMLRESVAIGVLALTRVEVRPFNDKEIELVHTFADQAAIAIENVRLFESAEARSRELAKSLEELRTAQDRLVQTEKLASLGQLTAGIAHEIKNPLNFVNNFSSVSAELVGELEEALAGLKLGGEARTEVHELAQMLKGNLEKIVQNGKRADSIVKNMLLHARQGSSEHRPVDINHLVEESLNLAYYGARAERQGFNITLERAFDDAAGEADLYPQEITRVLLNLISNGFYATVKRGATVDGGDYEATLKVATKDLGDSVQITVRDNGTGMPPEVKEKLFTPFFTTKPAGEGTGLGLSISHDIVVKQHGGRVEVDTKAGEFTEFRIILPRSPAGAADT